MNDKSTMELIQIALDDKDPDETTRWQAIHDLSSRGSREVFEAARQLCLADSAVEKCLGCDLLGQLASFNRSDFEEWITVLLPMVETENEASVLRSVISALGQAQDPRAIGSVIRHLRHPDPEIRWSVVMTLTACGVRDDSLTALIDLTKDPDALVRDWACHGLGTAWELDTPGIRDALAARLDDPDDVVRGEAMVGLARRRDKRVIGPLARELEAKTAASIDYSQEALEALGNIAEFPELHRWKTANDG